MVVQNNFDEIKDDIVEVTLADSSAFGKIVEVLSRIGIANYKTRHLYQTAHILHKHHKYYIVHFKSMLALDGKRYDITDDDKNRVKMIADILQQWGLCKLVVPVEYQRTNLAIITRSMLTDWTLVPKYRFKTNH